jgi:hypothetical protein
MDNRYWINPKNGLIVIKMEDGIYNIIFPEDDDKNQMKNITSLQFRELKGDMIECDLPTILEKSISIVPQIEFHESEIPSHNFCRLKYIKKILSL